MASFFLRQDIYLRLAGYLRSGRDKATQWTNTREPTTHSKDTDRSYDHCTDLIAADRTADLFVKAVQIGPCHPSRRGSRPGQMRRKVPGTKGNKTAQDHTGGNYVPKIQNQREICFVARNLRYIFVCLHIQVRLGFASRHPFPQCSG